MGNRVARFLPLVVGIVVLLLGLVTVSHYYDQKKPDSITGDQVISLSQCSGGYAQGVCPVVSLNWAAVLVNPSPKDAFGLIQLWDLQGSAIDTCGLPATYFTNIPVAINGTQNANATSTLPAYEPIGNGIEGMITYNSVVYFYTSDTYTVADGCSGTYEATIAGAPLQGEVTYSGAVHTTTLGKGLNYSFPSLDLYFAVLLVGCFLICFGFVWSLGEVLEPDVQEGNNAEEPSPETPPGEPLS
jgi:hypothetical protein